jgi:hypothetical protein
MTQEKKNFIVLVPQKLVVKPQSRLNGNKKFFEKILRVDDLWGDVTLEIYFACWIF